MAEPILIRVVELVGSPLCVASEGGQRVYDQISVALRDSKGVRLSFANVELVTSAFLNSAIGQLYDEFSEDDIRALLSVEDMEDDDLYILKHVIETAKEYFADPERIDRINREVLGATDE